MEEFYLYGTDNKLLATYRLTENSSGELSLSLVDNNIYFANRLMRSYDEVLVLDQIGNVKADRGRNTNRRMRYMPFGEEETSTRENRIKFGTYVRDEISGLDYAKRRYYSSELGRFISPDPYIGSIRLDDPDSWNRYAYCGNDPINRIDPHGTSFCGWSCWDSCVQINCPQHPYGYGGWNYGDWSGGWDGTGGGWDDGGGGGTGGGGGGDTGGGGNQSGGGGGSYFIAPTIGMAPNNNAVGITPATMDEANLTAFSSSYNAAISRLQNNANCRNYLSNNDVYNPIQTLQNTNYYTVNGSGFWITGNGVSTVFVGNNVTFDLPPNGLWGLGFDPAMTLEFAILHELGHSTDVLLSGDGDQNMTTQIQNNDALYGACFE